MNREELAWAAGFFDGEGCTSNMSAYRNAMRPTISIGQTDLAVLERFKAAVLGIGSIYGPYNNGPRTKPQWNYQTPSFEKTQAVIALLWNWLSPVKRAQATAALLKYREAITLRPRLRVGVSVICKRGHDTTVTGIDLRRDGYQSCRMCNKLRKVNR